MAKKVSKSRSKTFYKPLTWIELLGSKGSLLRGDQTHWSGRPDAPEPEFDPPDAATHPPCSTSTTDRTIDMIGRAGATPAHASPSHQVLTGLLHFTWRWATVRQVTSREGPERQNRDQARPLTCDRTRAKVWSSFASHRRLRQRTSALTGRTSVTSGHIYCSSSALHHNP
jgi:hypothetical protein